MTTNDVLLLMQLLNVSIGAQKKKKYPTKSKERVVNSADVGRMSGVCCRFA